MNAGLLRPVVEVEVVVEVFLEPQRQEEMLDDLPAEWLDRRPPPCHLEPYRRRAILNHNDTDIVCHRRKE